MKAIKLLMTTAFALVALSGVSLAGSGWMTDVDAALAKAKTEKKPVMVEFTGSDWCPPCIMMHKKVFSKKAFTDAASKKYILVKIDIPNKDKALKKKNQKVLKKYKVSGVPTVVLFGDDGKEFSRFSASQFPTVKGFLAQLDTEHEKKDMD
jgi:thiol:disulfide interchange protein